MLAALQDAFAAALLDPSRPTPAGAIGDPAQAPQRRFAVYRNNVVFGLVNALRARFPVVDRIVGEEFFSAMARVYVLQHPPRSKLLMQYGDDFAEFIAAFPPAGELGYLSDIARLEAARTRAYHATDAAPVAAEQFATLDPETLPSLQLLLHPSIDVVRSPYPIATIWAMNAGECALGSINDTAAEDVIVARPWLSVELRRLPAGGAAFVLALAAGASLGEAIATALVADPSFDPPGNLAGLIASGAVVGFNLAEQDHIP